MNERIEHTGFWWLPQTPELRIPGRLQLSLEEGILLHLTGNFERDAVSDPRGFNILGESSFGEPITIHQAFLRSSSSPGTDPKAGTSSYVANKAFIGIHFSRMQDAKFKSVSFQPTHLDRWLRFPIMDYEHKGRGFSLTYTRPEVLSFRPSDDLQVRIGFESTGPNIGSTVTDISFMHRARFVIEASEEAHFNTFGEIISHLANLIAIATVAPVRPVDVDGWILSSATSGDTSDDRRVKILLPMYTSPHDEDIQFFDMLFTYPDVEERFESFLENWFTEKEGLEPVFDLFFSVLYNTDPYPVTTFLNYAQAIETYHIRTMSDEVDPPKVHRERMRRIRDAAPEEFREWLGDKLGFSNRPTFAQRLKEVIDLYPYPVTGQAGDHEYFIRRVRDTRNYYTHYDPSLEAKAQKGGYLKGLTMTLGTLLEGHLLLELGFSVDEVRDMQWKRRRFPSAWL